MEVKVLILDPDSTHKITEITGIEYLAKKIKQTTRKNKMLKELLEKKVNSIINTNDLTDLQVWGIWCGIGFISAFIIMWII